MTRKNQYQSTSMEPTTGTDSALEGMTIAQILEVSSAHIIFSREDRRNKTKLLTSIRNLSSAVKEAIIRTADQHRSLTTSNSTTSKTARANREEPEAKRQRLDGSGPQVSGDWETSNFMKVPSDDYLKERMGRFIDRTGNDALAKATCCVCARELFKTETQTKPITDIQSSEVLVPLTSHPSHVLRGGQLFYEPAILGDNSATICLECDRHLQTKKLPPLSLANGMWLGDIPLALSILNLPERILIAKYFPAAYIVKLYPKKKNAEFWDKDTLQSGLKGNVSTYKLNVQDIAHLISGGTMPPPAQILSATIGITFVGPRGQIIGALPEMFRVKRQRVRDALVWLKQNNRLYTDITISEEMLSQLPVDGFPIELTSIAKMSNDTVALGDEHADYVPQDDDSGELKRI